MIWLIGMDDERVKSGSLKWWYVSFAWLKAKSSALLMSYQPLNLHTQKLKLWIQKSVLLMTVHFVGTSPDKWYSELIRLCL